jgi:hypothetical protein
MITKPCVRQFMTFTRAERASCRGLRLWGWCLLASLVACDGTPTEPPLEATTMTANIDVAMGTVTLYGRVISRKPTAETWFEWGTSVESLRYQTAPWLDTRRLRSRIFAHVLVPRLSVGDLRGGTGWNE